jgi:hypothetical protein
MKTFISSLMATLIKYLLCIWKRGKQIVFSLCIFKGQQIRLSLERRRKNINQWPFSKAWSECWIFVWKETNSPRSRIWTSQSLDNFEDQKLLARRNNFEFDDVLWSKESFEKLYKSSTMTMKITKWGTVWSETVTNQTGWEITKHNVVVLSNICWWGS